MIKRILIFLIVSVIFGSCTLIPSLNPLYKVKDIFFKESLLGTWASTEEKMNESWAFEKDKVVKNSYKLIHTKNGEKRELNAVLVKIGNDIFIDIFINQLKLEFDNYLYRSHFFPVHTFSKIKIEKDEIIIQMFDYEWMTKKIKEKQIEIDYIVSSDYSFLLTASTEDLQKFVIKNKDNKEAFYDDLILKKNKF